MEFKKIQDEEKESLLYITYDNVEKIEIRTGCIVTYTAGGGGTIDTTHVEEFLKCVDEEGNIHYYNSELREVDITENNEKLIHNMIISNLGGKHVIKLSDLHMFKSIELTMITLLENPDKARKIELKYNSDYEIVRTVLQYKYKKDQKKYGNQKGV